MKMIFIFSIIGVLFSGYLTIAKFITGYCPITESCALFLGQPACLYGLIMFLIIFTASLISLIKRKLTCANKIIFIFSLLGIIFSGYFSFIELTSGKMGTYALFLPSCVYGLAIYLIIFINCISKCEKK